MKKSLVAYLLLMASWAPVSGGSYCAPCGPLKPCELTASVRGGVEWMYYPDRKRNDYVNCVGSSIVIDESGELTSITTEVDTQVDTGTTPKFTDQFNLPWTVVGEIGYALSCNTEIFADFHYGGANGKSRSYIKEFDALTDPPNSVPIQEIDPIQYKPEELWNFTENYSDLKYFGGSIGIRHYFDPICNKAFPFFGVKVGVRHFDPIKAVVVGTVTTGGSEGSPQTVEGIYYDSYNHVHGGFQMGLSMKCGECISIFAMVEALGTCGFKPHESGFAFFNDGESSSSDEDSETVTGFASILRVPARRTFNILSFPVTVGAQYHF